MSSLPRPVLVTGATGYIGGRLVPRLLKAGIPVRVFVRDRRRVEGRPWVAAVEIIEGDMLEPQSVERALRGVASGYYLVHSMAAVRDFQETDRKAATLFAAAADPSVRILYLGGLMPAGERVSEHLRSRAEVGAILRRREKTLEFRAGPIIGSGSASFEMVRYLTERLPAMIAPRWIDNVVQPAAVDDVMQYLHQGLFSSATGVVEIGGDRRTFRQMMEGYASVRGLRRFIVPVPVLAPRLAGLWIGLVTPIPNRLAVPIVEGIIENVVADTSRARQLFPDIDPIGYEESVRLALGALARSDVETRWSGALSQSSEVDRADREGRMRETRTLDVKASPAAVFATFTSLGGDKGWLAWSWAWRLRGWIDRAAGGPGLRRGRRHPSELLCGEALDFWRVEGLEPDRLLRLRAEMKVPGKAWLQWEVLPLSDGRSRLVQTAIFAPRGLLGALYWYLLYPIHALIFSGLVQAIARASEARPDIRPLDGRSSHLRGADEVVHVAPSVREP